MVGKTSLNGIVLGVGEIALKQVEILELANRENTKQNIYQGIAGIPITMLEISTETLEMKC